MRSTNFPAPTGNSNAANFAQAMARKIKSEIQFFDSPTVRVEQTTRGVRFHARQRGGKGQSTPQLSHPFKIYQPSNFASFATGITFLDEESGAPTVCNIDATQPTDFSATPPTVNPVTDAWRFWSVRCGQVEVRPKYKVLNDGFYYSGPDFDLIYNATNYGYRYNIQQGTDGVTPWYSGLGFDDPTEATLNPPLIISSDATPGQLVFGIWIQIQDSTVGGLPVASIEARRIAIGDVQGNGPYPLSSENRICIGCINVENGQTTVIQEVFDHVNNRFSRASVLNWRGNYYADTGLTDPADLASQVIYPGDVVTYQSGISSFTVGYQNQMFMYTAGPSLWGSLINPPDLAKWARIMFSINPTPP